MNGIDELLDIMKKLRDPDTGCPWDLAQSVSSIAHFTLEEAYELVEAIENGDKDEFCDELGDLLYHIVFYSQMASEKGDFDFDDVCKRAAAKLVRRHPHVFAQDRNNATGSIADWEAIKKRERELKNAASGEKAALLDDISDAIPALIRAEKLQKRAASVGFDWPDIDPVKQKLLEEVEELQQQLSRPDNRENISEELGDLLFSCVNLARHLAINPESALRAANRKFTRRFSYIEKKLNAAGISLSESSLEEMDGLWEEAKRL